jgi:hypothetical protein
MIWIVWSLQGNTSTIQERPLQQNQQSSYRKGQSTAEELWGPKAHLRFGVLRGLKIHTYGV